MALKSRTPGWAPHLLHTSGDDTVGGVPPQVYQGVFLGGTHIDTFPRPETTSCKTPRMKALKPTLAMLHLRRHTCSRRQSRGLTTGGGLISFSTCALLTADVRTSRLCTCCISQSFSAPPFNPLIFGSPEGAATKSRGVACRPRTWSSTATPVLKRGRRQRY